MVVGWCWSVVYSRLTLVDHCFDLSLDSTRKLLEQSKKTPVSGVASSIAVKAKETVVVFWQDSNLLDSVSNTNIASSRKATMGWRCK